MSYIGNRQTVGREIDRMTLLFCAALEQGLLSNSERYKILEALELIEIVDEYIPKNSPARNKSIKYAEATYEWFRVLYKKLIEAEKICTAPVNYLAEELCNGSKISVCTVSLPGNGDIEGCDLESGNSLENSASDMSDFGMASEAVIEEDEDEDEEAEAEAYFLGYSL